MNTRSTASERIAGKATITVDFAYDGNGRGKGGTATISINGKKVGSGRVENTNANIFSADDAADVGIDEGTNVSSAYRQHDNRFTGKIEKVQDRRQVVGSVRLTGNQVVRDFLTT